MRRERPKYSDSVCFFDVRKQVLECTTHTVVLTDRCYNSPRNADWLDACLVRDTVIARQEA